MTELQRMKSDLRSDPELHKKYEDAIKQAADSGAKSDGEAILNAAKALGYTLSVSELEKEYAEAQELSEDELDRVSGGNYPEIETNIPRVTEDEYGHDNACMFGWHCYAAFRHTDSNDKRNLCWSNYTCFMAYE